jgi:AraC family transcriptional regulator
MPMIGHLPGQVGMVTYGVCCNGDGAGSFDYVCAVEVAGFDGLPPELARLRLAARRYAVFTHAGHLSGLRATVHSIWTRYLPGSGLTVAAAPDFERYGERFDPRSGGGEVEIWIPVQP